MDLELAGKTAIVTGGSRGIGKAIARQLALEGVDVVIVARELATLDATAKELAVGRHEREGHGLPALRARSGALHDPPGLGAETNRLIMPIMADTGSDESVQSMVRRAADAFGHLDILVNCAARPGGQSPPPRLSEISEEAFLVYRHFADGVFVVLKAGLYQI
jgi:NAD(P)-dependent dehydrogenase (short-subunit alcohol dehydrogenase family)